MPPARRRIGFAAPRPNFPPFGIHASLPSVSTRERVARIHAHCSSRTAAASVETDESSIDLSSPSNSDWDSNSSSDQPSLPARQAQTIASAPAQQPARVARRSEELISSSIVLSTDLAAFREEINAEFNSRCDEMERAARSRLDGAVDSSSIEATMSQLRTEQAVLQQWVSRTLAVFQSRLGVQSTHHSSVPSGDADNRNRILDRHIPIFQAATQATLARRQAEAAAARPVAVENVEPVAEAADETMAADQVLSVTEKSLLSHQQDLVRREWNQVLDGFAASEQSFKSSVVKMRERLSEFFDCKVCLESRTDCKVTLGCGHSPMCFSCTVRIAKRKINLQYLAWLEGLAGAPGTRVQRISYTVVCPICRKESTNKSVKLLKYEFPGGETVKAKLEELADVNELSVKLGLDKIEPAPRKCPFCSLAGFQSVNLSGFHEHVRSCSAGYHTCGNKTGGDVCQEFVNGKDPYCITHEYNGSETV